MIICVLDTETIGKQSQDLLNLGYKIVDINLQNGETTTILQRDYVVGKLFNNHIYMINDDFVGAEKYEKYAQAIKNKTCIKRSLKQMLTTFKRDFIKNKVVFAYAYNCKFDLDKINKSFDLIGVESPINEFNCFDIWGYSTQHFKNDSDFKKWAIENDQLTATGAYISTTVETVIRYLTQNLDFVEDHTALSDTQHETKILQYIVKKGYDITRPVDHCLIPSDKVFTKTITYSKYGLQITEEIEYKKTYERNGKITYKM